MLGREQPEAGQVARNLVGQALPHPAFDAEWIAISGRGFLPRDVDVNGLWRRRAYFLRRTLIEFFFEGRSRK
jgi:hypothetical protein